MQYICTVYLLKSYEAVCVRCGWCKDRQKMGERIYMYMYIYIYIVYIYILECIPYIVHMYSTRYICIVYLLKSYEAVCVTCGWCKDKQKMGEHIYMYMYIYIYVCIYMYIVHIYIIIYPPCMVHIQSEDTQYIYTMFIHIIHR